MSMRTLSVHELQIGQVLSQDLMSGNRVLVKGGSTITPNILGRLEKWLINSDVTIYVEDTNQKDSKPIPTCITPELTQKAGKAIKNLHETGLENPKKFKTAYEKSSSCMKDVVTQVSNAPPLIVGCDLTVFRNGTKFRDPHSLRTAILCICLAIIYNTTVPSTEEIDLLTIASASLIHDIGKTLHDSKNILSKLKPDRKLFKRLNLHPDMLKKPYELDWHSVYAFLALKDLVPEEVREVILLSGFLNERINELDKYGPTAAAARIIQIAHLYDTFLDATLSNGYSTPMENVHASLCHALNNDLIDAEMFELFMNNIEFYTRGTMLKLSTGDTAIVLETPKGYPTTPIVGVINKEKGGLDRLDLTITKKITITDIIFNTNDDDKLQTLLKSQLDIR